MSKLPVRLVETNDANVSGGVGHRSISRIDDIAVVGSAVTADNVSGGVVPLAYDEYAAMLLSELPDAPAAWFRYNKGITVTGSGVSQWDDQSGNARHLKQGTDANRPIALIHTGTNYLYLPGVASNFASCPDAAALSIDDIDVDVYVALNDWTPSANSSLVGRDPAGNIAFLFYVEATTGILTFYWSQDGTSTDATRAAASTVAPTVTDGSALYVRVVRAKAAGTVKFYTSSDGSTWTQLGSTVTGKDTNVIFDSTSTLKIGANGDGSTTPSSGKFYRMRLYNGDRDAGGTLIRDFNAADATDQASSFTASTGETWTINTSGAKPAQIVASTRIMGDGTASKMATDNYTSNQPKTRLILAHPISWTAADYLCSGTVAECGITQVTGTPQIGLNAGSAAAANNGATLGAWHVLCAIHNGESSSLSVDGGTAATGDNGANNPGGLTLFSNQAGAGYGNWMVKEVIEFDGVLSTTQIASCTRYLKGIGGVA